LQRDEDVGASLTIFTLRVLAGAAPATAGKAPLAEFPEGEACGQPASRNEAALASGAGQSHWRRPSCRSSSVMNSVLVPPSQLAVRAEVRKVHLVADADAPCAKRGFLQPRHAPGTQPQRNQSAGR
jgi:hypothetical protein